MKKIAFIIDYNPHKWLGGIYVIKNLINCIQKFSNNKFQVVLIVKKNFKKDEKNLFKNQKLLKTDIFYNKSFLYRIYSKLSIILLGKFSKYEELFEKEGISFISHINVFNSNLFFGKRSCIKALSFIPDLQHIYLKENFSIRKRLTRNLNILLCSLYSSKILLSSKSSRKDIKKVSNLAWKNSVISKFIFESPQKKDILGLKVLKEKYNFNQGYFYLPNQYWVHKNHEVVLKALKFIKQRYKKKRILIISSGNSEDHRNLNYFQKIKNYILKNNLKNFYKYIGVIPHKDVLSLMFHSIAVINPSKFEGRSSTVEQAKSLNKKIILSNLEIHKEQNPKNAQYFRVNDFKRLSYLLIKGINIKNRNNRYSSYSKIIKSNQKNLQKYYRNYIKILNSLSR